MLGVEQGDEVIVPTITFIAPINAVRYNGAEPVFMDSDIYYNIDVDKKKNVLKCIGIDVSLLAPENILSEYNARISEIITNSEGNNVESVKFSDLKMEENKMTGESIFTYKGKNYLPIFKSSIPETTIIPISGKGLWSTLFGYFALDSDFNTVKGITFYQHKETPGLGGEVDKGWFQNNFIFVNFVF